MNTPNAVELSATEKLLTRQYGGSSMGDSLLKMESTQPPWRMLAQCWKDKITGFKSCTLGGPTRITGLRIVWFSGEGTQYRDLSDGLSY